MPVRVPKAIAFLLVCACATSGQPTTTPPELFTTSLTTSVDPTSPPTTLRTETTGPPAVTAFPGVPFYDHEPLESAALRMVHNQLAALAAGEYEIAAGWSANEIAERVAELVEKCSEGSCQGPYDVELVEVDPEKMPGRFRVTHQESGESAEMLVGKFEFSYVVSGLPPLVPGPPSPTLGEQLVVRDAGERIVIARLGAFEVWGRDEARWIAQELAHTFFAWEGDYLTNGTEVIAPGSPTTGLTGHELTLMTRGSHPLAFDFSEWSAFDLLENREVEPPLPEPPPMSDGEFSWFAERGTQVIIGTGDAEGNLGSLTTLSGVDLLGNDYASIPVLSIDGSLVAYVDHADPRTFSHFYSPVVVVKDTTTGNELNRIDIGFPVRSLHFGDDWLIASGGDPETMSSGLLAQVVLVAINTQSWESTAVETPVHILMPTPSTS